MPLHSYTTGDFVRVRGPFEGFPGTVVGVDDNRLKVDVEVFGASTPLLLAPEDVVRIRPDEDGGGSRVREPRAPRHPEIGGTVEDGS